MSKATDDPTNSGAPVHIDAALIEAERQVRDLLTGARGVRAGRGGGARAGHKER